ncbi:NACHT domain-containing protein [Streptomyces sp. NPDC002156]
MRWRWGLVWVLGAGLVAGLGLLWWLKGVSDAGNAASVLGSVGVIALLAAWARRNGRAHSGADQVDEAAKDLARLVLRQWEEEATLRQLFDPAPLPVAWSDSLLPGVGDHRELVGDPVDCRADEPQNLARAFRALPRRRLVVIGAAGSGKSTFAVLLTLGLLRSREEGDPVPVLLSLASFDPAREGPGAWLRRRMTADCSALADTEAYGPTAVRDLLADGRILPVLDGLDELPAAGQAAVLTALNHGYATDAPLVLTCRTANYVSAVAQASVLAGSAVIEPAPVRHDDAVALLRLAAPPGRGHRWTILADHLRDHPEGPVAQALTSPLMVVLARSVYADAAGADPAELADPARFPTSAAVEHHLLDRLVPALYGRAHAADPGSRRWDPDRAQRYLTHLARYLTAQGTHDLAWWQLYRSVPVLTRTWSRALLWSLAAAIASAVPLLWTTAEKFSEGLTDNAPFPGADYVSTFAAMAFCMVCVAAALPRRGIPTACVTAACGALAGAVVLQIWYMAAGDLRLADVPSDLLDGVFDGTFVFLVVLLTTGPPVPPSSPSRASFTTRRWRRRLLHAAARTCGIALLVGAAFNVYWLFDDERPALTAVWSASLPIGLVVGIGLAALQWTRNSVTVNDVTTPPSSIRGDRRITLLHGAYAALLLSVLAAAVTLFLNRPVPPDFLTVMETAVQPYCISVGLLGVTLALASAAWPHYLAARLVLAARTRLPWRLQSFLADAHRLGVLRQVGPVHQFRHARIQHHLTESPALPAQRRPTEPSDTAPAATGPVEP